MASVSRRCPGRLPANPPNAILIYLVCSPRIGSSVGNRRAVGLYPPECSRGGYARARQLACDLMDQSPRRLILFWGLGHAGNAQARVVFRAARKLPLDGIICCWLFETRQCGVGKGLYNSLGFIGQLIRFSQHALAREVSAVTFDSYSSFLS